MKSLNSASAVLCRCTAAEKKEKIMVTQFHTIMVLKAAAATECYSVRDNNVMGTWKKAKKKLHRGSFVFVSLGALTVSRSSLQGSGCI